MTVPQISVPPKIWTQFLEAYCPHLDSLTVTRRAARWNPEGNASKIPDLTVQTLKSILARDDTLLKEHFLVNGIPVREFIQA